MEWKMTHHPEASTETPNPRLSMASTLVRFALIGAVLAAVAAAFAYVGGRFAPNRLTPPRFVDGFEEVNGVHAGFRRNHAKGVCVSGFFEGNGNGARLSRALVFQPGQVPVLGRFSLGGGQPKVADTPDAVRGLGLQFSLPDGELWRTTMINLPVFPFRTPEAFYEQLLASKPDPKTGKPDPANMQAFLAHHPETAQALTRLKDMPVASGFGNTTFHGLHAFRFINAAGDSTPVRWILAPAQPFEAASTASTPKDENYLFDALIERLGHQPRQPLQWHLLIIVGQPGDPTNDATMVWPADREQVDVGTLTLDRVESDDSSEVRDINFDPLVLPSGIGPSDDPLLSARSAVYSQSFTRREGERKQPSAITPAQVNKEDRR
jgi:catalase